MKHYYLKQKQIGAQQIFKFIIPQGAFEALNLMELDDGGW